MKPSRRQRRSPRPPQEEPIFCSQWVCQQQTPKVPAVGTILLKDAVTGEYVHRHRCAEHIHPMHTVIARVKS